RRRRTAGHAPPARYADPEPRPSSSEGLPWLSYGVPRRMRTSHQPRRAMNTIASLRALPLRATARLRTVSECLPGGLKALVAVLASVAVATPLAARWNDAPHADAAPADPPPTLASAL